MRKSPIYEVCIPVDQNIIRYFTPRIGPWSDGHVGHDRQRYSSLNLGAQAVVKSSLGLKDMYALLYLCSATTNEMFTINSWAIGRIFHKSADIFAPKCSFLMPGFAGVPLGYSLQMVFFRLASSPYFNLSLLTSDFYSLLFGTSFVALIHQFNSYHP